MLVARIGVSDMYGSEQVLMSFMSGISVGAVLVLISVRCFK